MTAFDRSVVGLVVFAAGVETGRRCYVSCATMLVAAAIYALAPMAARR